MQAKPKTIVVLGGGRNLYGIQRRITQLSLAICLLAGVAFASLPRAADSLRPKNILVLHSFTDRKALGDLALLRSTLRSQFAAPANFEVEYLESQRFDVGGYENSLSESLAYLYRGRKIDLIIAVVYPALRFAIDHRDRIFPGVPILFMSISPNRFEGRTLWPGVTGVTTNVDVTGTIELALHLHPDTESVAIVSGTSEFERFWLRLTNQELQRIGSKLKTTTLIGLPPDQLLKEIAELPTRTIVFFQTIPLESAQPLHGTYYILEAIARQFPTYCVLNYCFDHEAIGGSYSDSDIEEVMAGQLAARLLSGEKPDNIPVLHNSAAHANVDWRQLQRWNIPESSLPSNALVLFRQPTVWEQYQRYVPVGLAIIIVQGLLILGLLIQQRRKRKAEIRLRESEKRFRTMADVTPSLVWMSDKSGLVTYLNERRIDFTGRDSTDGNGDSWTAFVHPDDLQGVLRANQLALEQRKGFSKEYRLRRKDGVYRWMLDVAAPRINGDGTFAGFIGSASDVTDQKLAQEALETIGGRLIEAQEKERTRIARELHDDICQRLALLYMELTQAIQGADVVNDTANTQFAEIRRHCSEIAGDVQALSHELHSSKLEYLGIVAALASFCREFSKQHTIDIEFNHKEIPDNLASDISLCLFRVAQESLHNAVKYSGESCFSIDLRRIADQLQLEVRDAGVGFNLEQAKLNGGLGLVSMQERVHLMNGMFFVETKANHGTKIVVSVPWVGEPSETTNGRFRVKDT
ncbi:PAS domain S-box protein [Edaphobacter modestus]|uniref:histidine kinase n=1 Tax=Edaphobacter modestus TaxID=388466 RepID=A0A4Q7YRV3_9BACT|nr:PAS domain S-box protein [Edaphobacter modestus]RZU39914.1 PAS domain S-box-containing protein [Edaphobacter modestus]